MNNTVREVSLTYKNSVNLTEAPTINSSSDIDKIMRPVLEKTNQIDLYEFVYAAYLSINNKVLSIMKIAEGGTFECIIDIKKILAPAILQHAEGIVLAHNHPSGTLRPSTHDDNITRKIKESCSMLNIKFIDHLILSVNGYYSYADDCKIL
jgi:DNA repair protein RadC